MGPGRVIDEMLQDRESFPGGVDCRGQDAASARCDRSPGMGAFFQIEDPLPPSVVSLYQEFFRRLAKFISEGGEANATTKNISPRMCDMRSE